MKTTFRLLLPLLLASATVQGGEHEKLNVLGWTVWVNPRLRAEQPAQIKDALVRLRGQLEQITRVVPGEAVLELKKVPLWFNPPYPGTGPKAEYHPDVGWLKKNGRNPAMAKAVEFTNAAIFEKECRRMPVFVLHELAHAYHDRVLNHGREITLAYDQAKAKGGYESVRRRDAEGRMTLGRAYAMTNDREYFAETTEAYFGMNDFFPFDEAELKAHDPAMHELLGRLWKVGGTRASASPSLAK